MLDERRGFWGAIERLALRFQHDREFRARVVIILYAISLAMVIAGLGIIIFTLQAQGKI
ncbi:MAG: hypothetical protein ACYDCK_10365 [Thermoplasmatota archaeon]